MSIETASEINDEVETIVQDASFGLSDTISYINKGLKEISGLILLPKLLEVETIIDTIISQAYASLPDNFQRALHYCYSNTTNRKIHIYNDVRLLYRQFSRLDLGGQVVGVAVKGQSFYYQRIPLVAETLRIHYYKYPTTIVTEANQPDCLPEFLVRPLLVNYVAKEIYSLIEDGEDGQKTNTMHYEAKFVEAMAELNRYVGPEPREPQYIVDDLNLEGYL